MIVPSAGMYARENRRLILLITCYDGIKPMYLKPKYLLVHKQNSGIITFSSPIMPQIDALAQPHPPLPLASKNVSANRQMALMNAARSGASLDLPMTAQIYERRAFPFFW